MSARTGIAWTEATWNPWYGCTKVSPGCAHCYMFREQIRYGKNPEVVTRSKTKFTEPLKWKEPRLVFTCSWSDWFHEAADVWRPEAWEIIKRTPHLTYQILTKRPERIQANLPADWGEGYPNVWLGVSVENQRHAYRAAILAATPAKIRFISAEPLLGPVTLNDLYYIQPSWIHGLNEENSHVVPMDFLHWVIVGGESGDKCRPMKEEWARNLRDECAAAGVAFFLKQLGGNPDKRDNAKAVIDGQTYTEMPEARNVA